MNGEHFLNAAYNNDHQKIKILMKCGIDINYQNDVRNFDFLANL